MPYVLVALVCEAMLGAFLVSRYGNERMDYISPQQMAGLQELYRLAPPHSLLLSGSDNEAWRYTEYTTVTTESLTDSGVFPARLFV